MIKNNNQKVIRELAKNQNKAHQKRNRLLLMATILAAFVLTTVCSIGMNYYQTVQKREIALTGAQYNGSLNGPSHQQLQVLRKNKRIKAVGRLATAGTVIGSHSQQADVKLYWGNQTYWQQQKKPALITLEGRYPRKHNEILLSQKALDKLALTAKKIPQTVSLKVAQYDGTEESRSFKIVGVYQDYTNQANGFISQSYYQKFGLAETDLGSSRALISLKTPFFFTKDYQRLEQKLQLRNRQWLSLDTEGAVNLLQSLIVLAVVSCVIMLCAFLAIHNILYISIQQDIQFFGMLKTIGATKKQIKQIISRQFLPIALLGTSLGLSFGSLLSLAVVPSIIKNLTAEKNLSHAINQPLIFILAALFTLATVCFSSNLAAQTVAKLSPIEATKYFSSKQSRKIRKQKNGSRLWQMAWRNIFRNRKQAFLVLLSLFLGMTAFVTATSYITNNDGKRILAALNVDDLTLTNKTTDMRPGEQVFTPELLQKLQGVKGVRGIHPVTATVITLDPVKNPQLQPYIEEALATFWAVSPAAGKQLMIEQPADFNGVLKGIDETLFKRGKKNAQLQVDTKAFLAGDAAIANSLYMLKKDFNKVKSVTFGLEGATSSRTLNIAEVSDRSSFPSSPLEGFYPTFFVSAKYIQDLVGAEPYIDAVIVDYQVSYQSATENKLQALLKKHEKIDQESKLQRYQEMRRSEIQLKITGYLLVAILLILAVINFVNTITTSIFSRSREFGLLESIGMTKRQQRKMLMFEGLYYWLLASFLVIVIGLPVAYWVFQNNNDLQLDFLFPAAGLGFILSLILLLAIVCPLISYQLIGKKAVLKRIN